MLSRVDVLSWYKSVQQRHRVHGERDLKTPSHGRMINNCGVMQYGFASIRCTYTPTNQSYAGPLLREREIETGRGEAHDLPMVTQ